MPSSGRSLVDSYVGGCSGSKLTCLVICGVKTEIGGVVEMAKLGRVVQFAARCARKRWTVAGPSFTSGTVRQTFGRQGRKSAGAIGSKGGAVVTAAYKRTLRPF